MPDGSIVAHMGEGIMGEGFSVRRDDVKAREIGGTQAWARVLIDGPASGCAAASLSFVEIAAGMRWSLPDGAADAVVYARWGRARAGAEAISQGDLYVFEKGSRREFRAPMRCELLVLLMPPGAEQAYLRGSAFREGNEGPEPRKFPGNTPPSRTLKDGRSRVVSILQEPRVYAGTLHRPPGSTEYPATEAAELIYVTEGRGDILLDGRSHPFEPWTAIYVPPGTRQTWNVGIELGMKAVQFFVPGTVPTRLE
jgi:uncharacterized cupin superfamily protein